MLSTTIVHVCARCRNEKIRKYGHANNGAARARCRECEHPFILEPKGARYGAVFKEQVLRAYQDRMSMRGITRTFGVCYQTIIKWAGEKNRDSARSGGHAFAQ
jgi:transposase-like protein